MATETPTPPKITLVITWDPVEGTVGMEGPLDNRFLIYGMIMSALEAVVKRSLGGERTGGKIVVPRMFMGGRPGRG